MRTDRKPPLPKSPNYARPRRVLRSNSSSLQTPPGSLAKSHKPNRSWDMEETELRPEYRSISCELRALARMVQDEFGENCDNKKTGIVSSLTANSSPLFERGRFYDEYSTRRNEKLKRKKSETGIGEKTPYNLGVTVEPGKRRDSKKFDSLRKSVTAAYSVERSEPRYMLRSMSKQNNKPPLPLSHERSVMATTEKKPVVARRPRKVFEHVILLNETTIESGSFV